MKIFKPDYFDSFRCIASACPDSCCKEWAVVVDEERAEYYRSLPGSLGDRLREVLKEEDGDIVLTIENGRCPMWREDGLCRIQAELGESALCDTCYDFPRLTHDYGDFIELQLELSCPEAAKRILAGGETVEEEADLEEDTADYDVELMDALLRSREYARKCISNPCVSPGEALADLLIYGSNAADTLRRMEQIPRFSDSHFGDFEGEPIGELQLMMLRSFSDKGEPSILLEYYRKLEILTDRWRKRLEAPNDCGWKDEHRAIARYLVDRYWLQAVSDRDLYSRVEFIVSSCLLIKLLGGDVLETAQLFSKEIENDPDNVRTIIEDVRTGRFPHSSDIINLLLEK